MDNAKILTKGADRYIFPNDGMEDVLIAAKVAINNVFQ